MTRRIEFSSSLRYWLPQLSPAENRARFGRHSQRHGHNYRLDVTLRGEPDAITGMVINLTDLKSILEAEIMARFDHRDLNDDTDYFEKVPPTPENFARLIFGILRDAIPGGSLDRIRLHAGSDTFVDVIGPEA